MQIIQLISLVGFLALVLGSLRIRNLHFSFIVKSLVIWSLIGGGLYLVVQNKDRMTQQLAQWGVGGDDGVQVTQGSVIRIPMSSDGHFWARAQINGVDRRMLIDSGATVSAISVVTAEATGIDFTRGELVRVSTANGVIEARRGRISELQVGGLRTQDMQVYVAPSFDDIDVLGMNFLSRVKTWRVEDNVLILEPRVGG